jgi:uncharacterized membrane protein
MAMEDFDHKEEEKEDSESNGRSGINWTGIIISAVLFIAILTILVVTHL